MSDIALRVEGLGKRYRIGIREPGSAGGMYRYKSIRDSFGSIAKRPLKTLRQTIIREPMNEDNSFWALKDVDFEVKKGEVVGIIGRNGAGKSTLLKILSQITKPTTGKVDLFGRVGSLLEVGTGFHPELSGRENIYLNGAILGMTRAEVKSRFDEIVAFSEIEKFLDTPVKQYSSGMYMRLAFAVAAHLEPEILVVDEVLAVGDAKFQAKCLGKMKEVAETGRTVLFVSHSIESITLLCTTAFWFSAGQLVDTGGANKLIARYLNHGSKGRSGRSWQRGSEPASELVRLLSIEARAAEHSHAFDVSDPIDIRVEFDLLRRTVVHVSYHVFSAGGTLAFATGTFHDEALNAAEHEAGRYSYSCCIPGNLLNDGTYWVHIIFSRYNEQTLMIRDAVSLTLTDRGDHRGGWTGDWLGILRPILPWRAVPS